MISSLLPGIRELRTPLAVGYLWLFIAWTFSHRQIEVKADAGGLLRDIYDLLNTVGPTALIGVATFAAFLVGTVLSIDATKPLRLLMYPNASPTESRLVRWLVPSLERFQSINGEIAQMQEQNAAGLIDVWLTHRNRTAADLGVNVEDFSPSDEDVRIYEANLSSITNTDIRDLLAELPVLVNRLSIHDKQGPWQTYDRKSAEGNFRGCMALPLLIVLLILTFGVFWGCCFLLVIPPILLILGLDRAIEADADVMEAALQNIIDSDVLKDERRFHWSSPGQLAQMADRLFDDRRPRLM